MRFLPSMPIGRHCNAVIWCWRLFQNIPMHKEISYRVDVNEYPDITHRMVRWLPSFIANYFSQYNARRLVFLGTDREPLTYDDALEIVNKVIKCPIQGVIETKIITVTSTKLNEREQAELSSKLRKR